jgi:hypothetical protein
MGRGRWRRGGWGFAAALAVAATANTVSAGEVLYEQGGTRFAVGIEAGLGGFAVENAGFGAGNIDFNAPSNGPFGPSERHARRQWFEGYLNPSLEFEAPFFGFGHSYGLFSVVGALTRGSGDPTVPRSTFAGGAQHADVEDAVIGWRSGDLFAASLGKNAVEISGGRQSVVIGDAFLVGSGVINGYRRAGLYLKPLSAFDDVVWARLNSEPVRIQFFNLATRVDQRLMDGFDQPSTKFAGVDLALFESAATARYRRAAGEKRAAEAAQAATATRDDKPGPDIRTLGINLLHIYDAGSTPGIFSFPHGEGSPTLSVDANRQGLNVYSAYVQGTLFDFDPNLLFHSQFVLERNDAADRRVRAEAWYVEPAYKFPGLPWQPQINLRYAHFSGDPNPHDRVKQSYDPLFVTDGPRGFRSWTLGEIFGNYISSNSNLNVAMAQLKLAPTDTVETGAIYYNFRFDQVAQFNDPRITSRHAADELDLYATWTMSDWANLSGVVGFAIPGKGLRQAAQAFVADNGSAGGGVGKTMTLAKLILAIKY